MGSAVRRWVFVVALMGAGCASQSPTDKAWVEVTSPHFVVRGDVSTESAEELTGQLEAAYAAIRAILFSEGDEPAGRTPVVLLDDAAAYETVAPRRTAGYFIDFSTGALDSWTSIVMRADEREHALEVAQHELTHRFVAHHLPSARPWLNEGLAEFFSSMRVEPTQVVLGRSPNHLFGEGISLPAADRLRALPPDGFRSKSHEETAAAYLGAWALVHVLLLGEPAQRDAFRAYMNDIGAGRASEASAFAKHFDAALLTQVDAKYADFLRSRTLMAATLPLELSVARSTGTRRLSPAEVHRQWARLLSGSPTGLSSALAEVERAMSLDPKSPENYVLRAILRLRAKQPGAEADLRRAVELAPNDAAAARALGIYLVGLPESRNQEVAGLARRVEPVASSANDFLFLAMSEFEHGRTGNAMLHAVRGTKADSGCLNCYVVAAEAAFADGDASLAARVLRIAINLSAERASPELTTLLKKYEGRAEVAR
jgi:hypothetical protein